MDCGIASLYLISKNITNGFYPESYIVRDLRYWGVPKITVWVLFFYDTVINGEVEQSF